MVVVTFGADDGGDVVVTLFAGKGIDSAVEAGQGGPKLILDHVECQKLGNLFTIQPF